MGGYTWTEAQIQKHWEKKLKKDEEIIKAKEAEQSAKLSNIKQNA